MIIININEKTPKKVGFYDINIPTKSCIVEILENGINIKSNILPNIIVNDMKIKHNINIDKIINSDYHDKY